MKHSFLSFENSTGRASYKRYYLPQLEIKGYNVTIDGQNLFDQPIKNNIKSDFHLPKKSALFASLNTCENGVIWKIRLVLKLMTSQPG